MKYTIICISPKQYRSRGHWLTRKTKKLATQKKSCMTSNPTNGFDLSLTHTHDCLLMNYLPFTKSWNVLQQMHENILMFCLWSELFNKSHILKWVWHKGPLIEILFSTFVRASRWGFTKLLRQIRQFFCNFGP